MDNTIYYAMSTVAQVLAAIVALLGVFAIFRIQLLRETCYGLSQNFIDHFKNFPTLNIHPLKRQQIARNIKAIRDEITKFISTSREDLQELGLTTIAQDILEQYNLRLATIVEIKKNTI